MNDTMKKFLPIIGCVVVVIVLAGGLYYQSTQFMQTESVVSSETSKNISNQSVKEAIDLAGTYKSTLSKVSTVPITVDTLQTNPKPLFKASE